MAQGNFVTLTQLTQQLAVHKSNVLRDLRKWEKATGRNATTSKRVAGKRVCVLTQADADEFVAWRVEQYCLTVDKLSTVAARLETIVHQLVDLVNETIASCRTSLTIVGLADVGLAEIRPELEKLLSDMDAIRSELDRAPVSSPISIARRTKKQ